MHLNFAGKHRVFIQKIQLGTSNSNNKIFMLRLDEIDPVISGNKFFKLQLHLKQAIKNEFKTIATFGGAYSNHIVATACICNQLGLKSVGIIRGEELNLKNDTMLQASSYGMQLNYVSREAYKNKETIINRLNVENYYWINEGGYSCLGAEGAAEICDWIDDSFTDIVCAVGTGTMMAGLILGAKPHQRVTGISVLKGDNTLLSEVENLLIDEDKKKNYNLIDGYHFGGYAKHTNELIDWMNLFYEQNKVPTDIVYTSKLCYAVNDLFENNYFDVNSKVMIVHSGGLQGNKSLDKGRLLF